MQPLFDFNLRQYDSQYYRIYDKALETDLSRIPSFRMLKAFVAADKDEVVLDAGCGAGHLLAHVAGGTGARLIGVDSSEAALELARQRFPGPDYRQCDLRALDLPDSSVDKIVCFNVIEHIAEQAQVMAEFRRVLRSGGTLVIGTNIRDSIAWMLYQIFITEHTHIREFTVREFRTFLSEHFEVDSCRRSSGVFRFRPPISWIFHHVLLGDVIAKCRNTKAR